MAYRYGNRDQITFLPESVESYVLEDDPVRAYDAFIDALDVSSLGLNIDSNSIGNSCYDPIAMLKILTYGYSYGWRSSRKLERALHHNLSFIWLSGGLKPDHKTIANFRKNNKQVLVNVLKNCVRMCIKLNLIEGNVLFGDGSKIRANAGNNKTFSKKALEVHLSQVENKIESLLDECSKIDNEQEGSYVKMNKELSNHQQLKSKIIELISEIKQEKSINATDPNCKIMKSRQGSHAAYNAQLIVDDANGLIVSTKAVQDVVDRSLLADQVYEAEENMNKSCQTICADAGYSSVDALKPLVDSEREVIVPNGDQSRKIQIEKTPFDKENFIYDEKTDTYTCPEGKELYQSYHAKGSNKIAYRMTNYKDCIDCKFYGLCTSAKKGRSIYRLINEETQDILKAKYESESGQNIYRRRKMKVELPFGHIKRNMGVSSFLLRGFEGVNAELSILGTCFNLTRMINILGGVKKMTQIINPS